MEALDLPGTSHAGWWRFAPAAFAFAVLLAFAADGPAGPLVIAAILITFAVTAPLLPTAARVALLPGLGCLLLFGQVTRAIEAFDPIPILLAALAFVSVLMRGHRADWEIHRPGWLALAFLVAPLPALFTVVVSPASFLAAYKVQALWVLLLFALRRLVAREQSQLLLWVFPFVGTLGAVQLLAKTAGLGGLIFARMGSRNFYTRLPWGQSDFISATLEFSICMTLVLLLLDRRPWVRLVLAGCCLVMLQAFLLLFSRAGAVSLGAFALVLVFGLGGRRAVVAAGAAVGVALAALGTPGGQTLLSRFTDPSEYNSWYYRLVIWENSWQRFVHRPWTGIGLNQGRYVHDFQAEEGSSNMILEALMQQGIFGGVVVIVIMASVFVLAGRVRPHGFAGNLRTVRVALVAAVCQVFLHAMGEPTMAGPTIAIPFVYLLAWLLLNDEPDPGARSSAAPARNEAPSAS